MSSSCKFWLHVEVSNASNIHLYTYFLSVQLNNRYDIVHIHGWMHFCIWNNYIHVEIGRRSAVYFLEFPKVPSQWECSYPFSIDLKFLM